MILEAKADGQVNPIIKVLCVGGDEGRHFVWEYRGTVDDLINDFGNGVEWVNNATFRELYPDEWAGLYPGFKHPPDQGMLPTRKQAPFMGRRVTEWILANREAEIYKLAHFDAEVNFYEGDQWLVFPLDRFPHAKNSPRKSCKECYSDIGADDEST